MSELHEYAYRVPRFALQIPVAFCIGEVRISGFSKDLSNEGLQVRLSGPVILGTCGRVRLHLDSCLIEIWAEVVHSDLLDVGLRFRFSSRAEEDFIRTLVKLISKNVGRSGNYAKEIQDTRN